MGPIHTQPLTVPHIHPQPGSKSISNAVHTHDEKPHFGTSKNGPKSTRNPRSRTLALQIRSLRWFQRIARVTTRLENTFEPGSKGVCVGRFDAASHFRKTDPKSPPTHSFERRERNSHRPSRHESSACVSRHVHAFRAIARRDPSSACKIMDENLPRETIFATPKYILRTTFEPLNVHVHPTTSAF